MRFGSFELDVRSRELRKDGSCIRLQEQPFEILRVMLERPGDVVTRDELCKRLWPDGTFVDFEHSLNAAVKRLRGKLWYAPVGFELLPDTFTLFDLQKVYEAILGEPLNRDMFRKRILRSGLVARTGTTRTATYRAPELYRFAGGANA